MLPLPLKRHFSSLAITSTLSVCAVLFIIVSVAIEAPSVSKDDDDIKYKELSFIRSTWFAGAGTMAFAFVCHHNVFIVYNSLRDQNLQRWKIVSNSSVGLAFILSIVMCLVGYLYFRDDVEVCYRAINNKTCFIFVFTGFFILFFIFLFLVLKGRHIGVISVRKFIN